jgi:hypothetical protein
VTIEQTAINHRALMAATTQLENAGYKGDAFRFIENLILTVLADGYRRIEPPPPPRGPGAGRQAIDACKAAAAQAVADARARRNPTQETA